jgi:hypothetical protein
MSAAQTKRWEKVRNGQSPPKLDAETRKHLKRLQRDPALHAELTSQALQSGAVPVFGHPDPEDMPPPDHEDADIDAYLLRELALYGARQKLSVLDLERARLESFIKRGGKW